MYASVLTLAVLSTSALGDSGPAARVVEHRLEVTNFGASSTRSETWRIRIDDPTRMPEDLQAPPGLEGATSSGARIADGRLVLPTGEGIRVDTHLREGDRISPHYDSMFAKIIAWGPDRDAAIARMVGALDSMEVEGVPTTAALHRRIITHDDFRSGRYDTRWLERTLPALMGEEPS